MAKFSLAQPYRDKAALLGALLASSLLSVLIFAGRVVYSGHWTYIFLNWNLFLAWLPLCSAFALWHVDQRKLQIKGLRWLLLLCWLLFFPNSPYLVTDFVHLTHRQKVPLWYDMMLIFSFAWDGLMLGFISLWIVQEFIQTHWGKFTSWLIVGFCLLASGFGIYLGRFLHWNSWDFLLDPHALLADILTGLRDPLTYPRILGVTFLFFSFLTIAYITLTLLVRVRWARVD
ncbi:MAG: DUF1361 domain-containing protein [Caldilineaceae bacterium]